ncbi:hypothetical protein MNBD_GAMMA09-2522 [hydrothermal vent metagenome]|uniref:2-polyprenylphenol hydroxylase and related flavodoxin oxidoreductases / CDP-6-deoxy-delta-3,4-glucoseen reductase-like n=1 Tax=hydrothermal vent metagenome TaxID=652676 RepID=A0A3B0XM45_9ZZZZ
MIEYAIHYKKKLYTCRSNETVLQAFLRQGVDILFSCGKGSCQVCMMCCDSGVIPKKSQKSIRLEYVEKKYFLPCSCYPESVMRISEIPSSDLYKSAIVHKKESLSDNILHLVIEPAQVIDYKPGQYVNIRRVTDGLARSYSLISHPDDYFMEFHIKTMPKGRLSSWLSDNLKEGDEIEFQGPMGESYYEQIADINSRILLAATGTGLAPLLGVIHDAIRNAHKGDIYLYHGGRASRELYFHKALLELSAEHNNIYYRACLDSGSLEQAVNHNILDVIKQDINEYGSDYIKSTVFLAGSTAFVESSSLLFKQYGFPDELIFSDSFDLKNLRGQADNYKSTSLRRVTDVSTAIVDGAPSQVLHPDDEMWQALEYGKKLTTILEDFYAQVYQDDKLSAFFENSTQQRSREKQYLFMRQLFTGGKVYFGDRPKNAHHWMVISDELFDYRENLMANCLRTHGLAEHLIQRWITLDESFRQDIVKSTPQAKVVNGQQMPLDGFDEMVIDVGSICDGCQQTVEAGETVRYHLRLGHIYCNRCFNAEQNKPELNKPEKNKPEKNKPEKNKPEKNKPES